VTKFVTDLCYEVVNFTVAALLSNMADDKSWLLEAMNEVTAVYYDGEHVFLSVKWKQCLLELQGVCVCAFLTT